MSGGVPGGVSARPLANGQAPLSNPDLLSANTTIIQSGGGAFARLINALQLLDQSSQVIELATNLATLQADITTLQGQVTALQTQVATLQTQTTNATNWINDTTAEISTGFTWLDGRTLYKRCNTFTMTNVTNGVATFAHNITQLAYIAEAQAVMQTQNGNYFPQSWVNPAANPPTDGTGFYLDTTNMYVANDGQIRTNYLIVLRLWYTALNR